MKKTVLPLLIALLAGPQPVQAQVCGAGFPLAMPNLGSLPSLAAYGLNLPLPNMSMSMLGTAFPLVNAALPSFSGLALPIPAMPPGMGLSLPTPSFNLPVPGLGGAGGLPGLGLLPPPSMNLSCLGLCCG